MTTSGENESRIANIPPFGLRLQPSLKRRVEEAARANGRSLNSEIVARLEASFQQEDEIYTIKNDIAALKGDVLTLKEDVARLVERTLLPEPETEEAEGDKSPKSASLQLLIQGRKHLRSEGD